MHYTLSLGSFFIGVIILTIGIVFVRFYQWVADNFGSGVGSYERYRLYALLTCVLGFIVMVNLHIVLLEWFSSSIFRHQ